VGFLPGKVIPSEEPAPTDAMYERYKFFKADPILWGEATWGRVERIKLRTGEKELYEMVHERADKYSAYQQYKHFCDTHRSQVNLLVQDRREDDPQIEWSYVYAEQQTVFTLIIIMRRPVQTGKYRRTPLGDLVDLNFKAPLYPFKSGTNHPRYSGTMPCRQRPAEYHGMQSRHSASEP
jgi:hypothetical protein